MDVGMAIVAGLIGGAAMSVVLYMGIALMPAQMRMNLFLMLGTMMVFRGGMAAYVMGAMVHAVMSIVFGLIHIGVLSALGVEGGVGIGLLFGLVHWAVVGMAFGMIRPMHQLMRSGEMEAPGFFALSYPMATAAGFLMLHLLYGLLVSVVYVALV